MDERIYISEVEVRPFGDETLVAKLSFNPGLNLLSGENGTGKTKILLAIKNRSNVSLFTVKPEGAALQIAAISPKRNAERKSAQEVFQFMRQHNRRLNNLESEFLGKNIDDATFQPYSSFVETFVYLYDERTKDGDTPNKQHMETVANEFNKVLRKTFSSFKLRANWEDGAPNLKIKKKGKELEPAQLSCGETEVLSLIFNIYANRDKTHIYLIDEPEVHLNWSLEFKLFKFFRWFCNVYKKQIIVATHSRAAFRQPFYGLCQFLVWEGNKIVVKSQLSKDQKNLLADEAISFVRTSQTSNKTFFVEDDFHKLVVSELNKKLRPEQELDIVVLGQKANVVSMYKLAKETGTLGPNAYFMVDGDGEGNSFKKDPNFIFLEKYCAENYFFDFDLLAVSLGTTASKLQSEIHKLIIGKGNQLFKKNKHTKFIIRMFREVSAKKLTSSLLSDLDCSDVLTALLQSRNRKIAPFVRSFISGVSCPPEQVFEPRLIAAIKK